MFLLLSVILVYCQVSHHQFINFDDEDYVYKNPYVMQGFSASSIYWSLTTMHSSNWHPLTWMSHILDVQLFGMNPAGHHLMNVAFHAANSILLFLVFCRLSGALWRSFVLAALFALHPLHVESVAWIAERKDVLSTFFGFLTIYFYSGYVKQRNFKSYLSVQISLVLSLLAKPMLVTLPIILLLIDYWPLERFIKSTGTCDLNNDSARLPFVRLLQEKLPLFILVSISSIVTLYAQYMGGSVSSFIESSLSQRIANALVVYIKYLGKTFWPIDLALVYDFPETLPLWQPIASGIILVLITLIAVMGRKQRPYLYIGWFWYLFTLVPVIGIVRIGAQAMADRYTYVPLVGIFIIVVWGFVDITSELINRSLIRIATAFIILLLCSIITWRQISLWTDNFTLYNHTLSITRNNWVIQNNIGVALFDAERLEEALYHFEEAIKINPYYIDGYLNMESCLSKMGRTDKSIVILRNAIELGVQEASIYTRLAHNLLKKEQTGAAIELLRKAININPSKIEIYCELGFLYGAQGMTEEAVEVFKKGVVVDSGNIDCRYNLGVELYKLGRCDEAASQFHEVLRLNSDKEIGKMSNKFLNWISEGGCQ
jgi:Tfp pilus assembly protein PilF